MDRPGVFRLPVPDRFTVDVLQVNVPAEPSQFPDTVSVYVLPTSTPLAPIVRFAQAAFAVSVTVYPVIVTVSPATGPCVPSPPDHTVPSLQLPVFVADMVYAIAYA